MNAKFRAATAAFVAAWTTLIACSDDSPQGPTSPDASAVDSGSDTALPVDSDKPDTAPPAPGCGNGALDSQETCDDGNKVAGDGCSESCNVEAFYTCTGVGAGGCTLNPVDYLKASNANEGDVFGGAISLSGNGNTLAVGAHYEASGAAGDQSNNAKLGAGAVYVFTRTGSTWTQEAYIKAATINGEDFFGASVSISADGNTLAVGAPGDDTDGAGINAPVGARNKSNSGAAYVYKRASGAWAQQSYIKANSGDAGDAFGTRVAISGSGTTLAVGAPGEDANATGVNGDQTNNAMVDSGAVYLFQFASNAWTQQAYLKASNASEADAFGTAIALSSNGNTLAVGAYDDSAASGINGDQQDKTMTRAGAVYLFERTSSVWAQQAYIKAGNSGPGNLFGGAVSLSGSGNTLAVGAHDESTGAIAAGDDPVASGAVYVFARNNAAWSQVVSLKASNAEAGDHFGESLALALDGNSLVVGAPGEASGAVGIQGNQANNGKNASGAAYLFGRINNAWTQRAYIKAPNTDANDRFGASVAMNGDGKTMVVGAREEASNATGINGNQADNSAPFSGAVYVHKP